MEEGQRVQSYSGIVFYFLFVKIQVLFQSKLDLEPRPTATSGVGVGPTSPVARPPYTCWSHGFDSALSDNRVGLLLCFGLEDGDPKGTIGREY